MIIVMEQEQEQEKQLENLMQANGAHDAFEPQGSKDKESKQTKSKHENINE